MEKNRFTRRSCNVVFLISEFGSPSSFLQEVKEWGMPENIPENCFGFYFIDFNYDSNTTAISNRFFIGGEIYTAKQLNEKMTSPEYSRLRSNVEFNEFERVIKTPFEFWYPFFEDDVLLESVEVDDINLQFYTLDDIYPQQCKFQVPDLLRKDVTWKWNPHS